MQLTKEQRIFIVLEYETTKNSQQVKRAFNETFPERNSSEDCVSVLLRKADDGCRDVIYDVKVPLGADWSIFWRVEATNADMTQSKNPDGWFRTSRAKIPIHIPSTLSTRPRDL
ncbi:Protein of unknown function DUF4817 [Trinorchestia longiramus]|nr:Protein of unknown function DUF4817 [Trinorchestia longiramus]